MVGPVEESASFVVFVLSKETRRGTFFDRNARRKVDVVGDQD
jgi:hypothetical protein